MIVIKVEMWPQGDRNQAREFARAYIYNRGDTTRDSKGQLGDYAAEFHGGGNSKTISRRFWKQTSITGFHRASKGAWDLLYLVLKQVVGERNS